MGVLIIKVLLYLIYLVKHKTLNSHCTWLVHNVFQSYRYKHRLWVMSGGHILIVAELIFHTNIIKATAVNQVNTDFTCWIYHSKLEKHLKVHLNLVHFIYARWLTINQYTIRVCTRLVSGDGDKLWSVKVNFKLNITSGA